MRIPTSTTPILGAYAADCEGPNWTASWSDVTSWLMEQAEARFGPRDQRWFFTGLEFGDVEIPTTYHPGNRPFHVGIRLTRGAAMAPAEAYFQLAHEVVHLLGPSPNHSTASVMEEGMAASFQQDISNFVGLGREVAWPSYLDAMAKLAALQSVEPQAVAIVRRTYPDLRNLTEAELVRIVPGVPASLAGSLCATFAR